MTPLPAPQQTQPPSHDIGLVRLLGLVVLLPVGYALTTPSPSHIAAAGLGLVAITAHEAALWPRLRVRSRALVPALCLVILACGILAHVLTGQSWVLCGTAAALVCAVGFQPLPVAIGGVVGCAVIALSMGPMQDTVTTIAVVAGPGAIAALRHRLLVTIAELNSTREQLAVAAVRQERERFSDDLHDVLGHSLSVIVVAAQMVQRTAAEHPDDAREAGRQIETIGRKALDDVRATVLDYRPPSFQDETSQLEQALRTAGLKPRFSTTRDLPPETEPTLVLVLREAITNVIRHAHASRCEVTVHADAARVTLDVADDGRGGTEAATRANNGLATIRSRISHLGGTLTVTTVNPHGLRLSVAIPVSREK